MENKCEFSKLAAYGKRKKTNKKTGERYVEVLGK
jgi:hypothetical protein